MDARIKSGHDEEMDARTKLTVGATFGRTPLSAHDDVDSIKKRKTLRGAAGTCGFPHRAAGREEKHRHLKGLRAGTVAAARRC